MCSSLGPCKLTSYFFVTSQVFIVFGFSPILPSTSAILLHARPFNDLPRRFSMAFKSGDCEGKNLQLPSLEVEVGFKNYMFWIFILF